MKKIILFSLLTVGFLLFLPSNSQAVWSDPSCAPPGCNRPEPITVEGGTILNGYQLSIQGTDGDTVINSAGIKSGGKITADSATINYITDNLQVMECTWVTISNPDSDLYPGYTDCQLVPLTKVQNVYFDDLVIANQGVLLGQGQSIYGITGENSIQISEGLGGGWGYGILAQAHPVGIAASSNDTIGVWGKAAVSNDNDLSYGIYGQGSGINTYGVYATNIGVNSYALVASSKGGGAAYLVGDVYVDNGELIVNGVSTLGLYDGNVGGYPNVLTVNGDVSIKLDERYENRSSAPINFIITSTFADASGRGPEYTPLMITSENPNKVFFGTASDSGIEICLNNDCISSWPSGGGGGSSQSFKFVDVPSGNDPQADSSADTLQFLNGDNISITGSNDDKVTFSVDRTLDYIERINAKHGEQLVIDPDDDEGLLIYDNIYIDDLSGGCNVKTYSSGKLYCGTDSVDDADHSSSNELQTIDGVLTQGSITTKTITVGELCVNNTCLTEKDLKKLLKLIR